MGLKRTAAALLAGALSLSCVVFAQHPLLGERPVVLDPELAGGWLPLEEDGEPDPDEERVLFESHGDHYVVAGDEAEEIWEITTASLDGRRYLNMVEVGDGASGVAIWRYELRDDTLALAAMDYDAAKRLVKSGVLRGIDSDEAEATDGRAGDSTRAKGLLLTASSEDLEAYLLERGPFELFPELEPALVREPARVGR